jgi:heme-degrading monooxygenase HmoA
MLSFFMALSTWCELRIVLKSVLGAEVWRNLDFYVANSWPKGPRLVSLVAMILEVAVLNVRQGLAEEFEQAFMKAQSIISSVPGYRLHEVRRCLESTDKYLLLVWWKDLESHTIGFRQSPEYEEWKQLLHHFYDPFPVVEHFEEIEGLQGGAL